MTALDGKMNNEVVRHPKIWQVFSLFLQTPRERLKNREIVASREVEAAEAEAEATSICTTFWKRKRKRRKRHSNPVASASLIAFSLSSRQIRSYLFLFSLSDRLNFFVKKK